MRHAARLAGPHRDKGVDDVGRGDALAVVRRDAARVAWMPRPDPVGDRCTELAVLDALDDPGLIADAFLVERLVQEIRVEHLRLEPVGAEAGPVILPDEDLAVVAPLRDRERELLVAC